MILKNLGDEFLSMMLLGLRLNIYLEIIFHLKEHFDIKLSKCSLKYVDKYCGMIL